MTPSKIERKYRNRAYKLLEQVGDALNEAGLHASTPWEFNDDALRVQIEEGQEGDYIDIAFEFLFSERCDGELGGVNFGVNITHESGYMIGGLTPYNYSPEVWVPRKDAEAVEKRFQILERADVSELVYLVEDYRKRQKADAERESQADAIGDKHNEEP